MYKIIILLVFPILITGCIQNPINAKTAQNYYKLGMTAEHNGNLPLARKYYSRAAINAQMGNLGYKSRAYSTYEWSRVTGYLGMFEESAKGFNDVLQFIQKAKGKADKLKAPTLSELARLYHDTNKHSKAVVIYKNLIIELESLDILNSDPIGYSAILDDYYLSLKFTEDTQEAEKIKQKSITIKNNNKVEKPKFIGRRYKSL